MITLREPQPSDYFERADELLTTVTPIEIQDWKDNLITKSLILRLAGDKLTLNKEWEAGDYTAESVEGTAQKNARALGAVQSIASLMEWIQVDMFKTEEEDN